MKIRTSVIVCLLTCSCAAYKWQNVSSATQQAMPSGLVVMPTVPVSDSQTGTNRALTLSLEYTVLTALENNAGFRLEKLEPDLTRTGEELEKADFDPILSGSAGGNKSDGPDSNTDSLGITASLTERLPSGTDMKVAVSSENTGESATQTGDDSRVSREIGVRQPLLRGGRMSVNMARLHLARLETGISMFELRAAAESLVAMAESAYWDCVLAERAIEIHEKSLEVAEREVDEVSERIRVGSVAKTELAVAQAEAASRSEQLIEARGIIEKKRLALLRLLNVPSGSEGWDWQLVLIDGPEAPTVDIGDVSDHVNTALAGRADLNQARLKIRQGDIEIVRTRNGLLPKLDLFATLGGSRYANSLSNGDNTDRDETSYSVGLNVEYPLWNRGARAMHERARVSRAQVDAALLNMELLVQVDVRSAYVDVARAEERVKATKATRQLRELTLSNEQEKFRVGRSTTFVVSQTRRDMVASQLAEVDALIALRRALLDLHRLDGTLLDRRGIAVATW